VIGRIIRRILHRLIRGLVTHPIRGVIVLVAVLVAAGILAFQSTSAQGFNLSLRMPSMSIPGAGGPPAATEDYMKGTAAFNAELIWGALGEEAVARYRGRGGSLQALQGQMEQAKQAGAQVEEVKYIGGQAMPDGTSMHFYVVLARGPQSRGEAEYVPYVFTLDQAGKIAQVQ
jgi:hypothetical protein